MALCKFAAGIRTALNINRNIWVQQQATIKQSTKEKLKQLNLPEKPKKPLSPYFRFLKDHRDDIMRKNPNTKVTDVAKQVAADWAKADSSIKEKYATVYKQEMEDYSKKFLEYSAKLTPEQKESLRDASLEKQAMKKRRELRKKLRENDKPKRPLGPYMQFLLEKSKHSDRKMYEIMHDLKGQWQAMPVSERQRFVQMYEDDKKRYDLQMKTWEKKMIAEGHTDLVRHSTMYPPKAAPASTTRAASKPEKGKQ